MLALPSSFLLGADRSEAINETCLETGLRRDRFLRAIEFRPERPNVVRSTRLFVVPKGGKPRLPGSWARGQVW